MRKGQRFTPARLRRWLENGRGTGLGADYQPWHQVTRDDPGSRGRSHLLNWRFGRLHHLLSDQELVAFGFATMLPNVVDIREQYPLALDEHAAELANYRISQMGRTAEGTCNIAKCLGFKHPIVRKGQDSHAWIMSTDMLLTLIMPNGQAELLAISVKHDDELTNERTRELLKIEREYWWRQDVFWLLLAPSLYDGAVANSIRTGMLWTIGQPNPSSEILNCCRTIASDLHGRTLTSALMYVCDRLRVDIDRAQKIFWQAVWAGVFPVNLSRRSWASSPVELIDAEPFWRQNPVAARRTICLP